MINIPYRQADKLRSLATQLGAAFSGHDGDREHDLAVELVDAVRQAVGYSGDPWCRHDAPYLHSGDVCECGEVVP